ncbi:molybdenum cofactor sulfurase isoform X2 [Lycorma delicatula]
MVAETFNFKGSNNHLSETGHIGSFAYIQDNHTSVLGMREVVSQRGAQLWCIPHDEAFELMNGISHGDISEIDNSNNKHFSAVNSLFVFPAQCNFSGLKYPLTWIEKCHQGVLNKKHKGRATSNEKWYCMLDAAALVSTSQLDLSTYKPDFVCLSFYKLFGFPTGLGALLVNNKRASSLLIKSYYGGGTVLIALSSQPYHVKRPSIHERFEDGTLDFLSIISLLHGLKALQQLSTDMQSLSLHCFTVARYLHNKLLSLHHANNKPAVMLYCDTDFTDPSTQGNIVNFNIIRSGGEFVGYAEVQALTNLYKIHIRTGCFCNPGACQRHLKLTDDQLMHNFQEGHVCGDNVDLVDGQPTGSIRISFGPYSRLSDADKFIALMEDCFVLKPVLYKVPDSWSQTSKKLMSKFKPAEESGSFIRPEVLHKVKEGSVKDVSRSNNETVSEPELISTKSICEIERNDVEDNVCELEKIFIYPVKSCAAMAVGDHGWPIDCRGFKYDRQWMVITSVGVALTQKTEPRLCLINPHLTENSEYLILSAPGMEDCYVPIHLTLTTNSTTSDVDLCQSKVCGDRVLAIDCGEEVASWLADVLGRPGVRLVKQSSDDGRVTLKSRRKDVTSLSENINEALLFPSPKLSLSNQAQFLLINMATINWLADRLPPDADCDKGNLLFRFRSNFVIDGQSLKPFAEQNWTKVQIGSKYFKVTGPCNRCQMICIDQFTGEHTKEPLTTLAACHRGKLQFGVYLQQIFDNCNFNNVSGYSDCEIIIGDRVKVYSS